MRALPRELSAFRYPLLVPWVVRCPAKVNWSLAVGPPDARGYHPLRTVFQAIGLFDILNIQIASTTEVTCDWAGMPERNTLTRALSLAHEYAYLPPLHVHLTKRIPAESGLGGGSSDAAGLLRALATIAPEALTPHVCHEIAAAVGADVPFFLVGGRARGEGYGDRLTSLPDQLRTWLVIVRPNEGVATAEAYRRLDEIDYPWASPGENELFNDFERVAPCICGEIAERLQVHGAQGALLSGSGSAVFGVFDGPDAARQARDRLATELGFPAWVAPTLTRKESLWMWSS